MLHHAIVACLGITAGNYLYQLISGDLDWWLAFERSVFMILAVALLAWEL